jgi:hypothetical protein
MNAIKKLELFGLCKVNEVGELVFNPATEIKE